MVMEKIILVTGSSSGFGDLTAKYLAKNGNKIYASMRNTANKNFEKAQDLREWAQLNNFNLKVRDLDVTDY